MSEAAGFIINVKPGTSVRGKVELWSSKPLTRDEALNALDTVLNQNGLAAIRNGRTLSIVNEDEAKIQAIPVISESDPNKIPMTDQIVTQIIPVRFVEVAQLVKDLQPLVSLKTTITANDSGNAVVITDTRANIHRVADAGRVRSFRRTRRRVRPFLWWRRRWRPGRIWGRGRRERRFSKPKSANQKAHTGDGGC